MEKAESWRVWSDDAGRGGEATLPAGWRGKAAGLGRAMARGWIDLAYPPTCIGCGASTQEPHALCAACWRGVPFIERPYCERLGTPLPVDFGGALLSPAAMASPPVFGRMRAVARYDGLARELVHRLKFGDRLDLAPAMGRWMARAGAELLDDLAAREGVIVPVALHWTRLWRRRMNQAAILAKAIQGVQRHERGSAPALLPAGLARRRATRPQVGLTRSERAANLQGVFVVPHRMRAAVEGRHVLLVDDVSTTGSTLNAASRALLRAGAARVDTLVFAVVCTAP